MENKHFRIELRSNHVPLPQWIKGDGVVARREDKCIHFFKDDGHLLIIPWWNIVFFEEKVE